MRYNNLLHINRWQKTKVTAITKLFRSCLKKSEISYSLRVGLYLPYTVVDIFFFKLFSHPEPFLRFEVFQMSFFF